MGIRKKLKIYKKAISQFKDEREALEKVMAESSQAETNLKADHTEKQYRWKEIR